MSLIAKQKIWEDEVSEFHNRSMKSWFQVNDIEMYSTRNEVKSVVAGRIIRTLNNKIYKYMTSKSRNVYKDNIADTVYECKNTYQRTLQNRKIFLSYIKTE